MSGVDFNVIQELADVVTDPRRYFGPNVRPIPDQARDFHPLGVQHPRIKSYYDALRYRLDKFNSAVVFTAELLKYVASSKIEMNKRLNEILAHVSRKIDEEKTSLSLSLAKDAIDGIEPDQVPASELFSATDPWLEDRVNHLFAFGNFILRHDINQRNFALPAMNPPVPQNNANLLGNDRVQNEPENLPALGGANSAVLVNDGAAAAPQPPIDEASADNNLVRELGTLSLSNNNRPNPEPTRIEQLADIARQILPLLQRSAPKRRVVKRSLLPEKNIRAYLKYCKYFVYKDLTYAYGYCFYLETFQMKRTYVMLVRVFEEDVAFKPYDDPSSRIRIAVVDFVRGRAFVCRNYRENNPEFIAGTASHKEIY